MEGRCRIRRRCSRTSRQREAALPENNAPVPDCLFRFLHSGPGLRPPWWSNIEYGRVTAAHFDVRARQALQLDE